MNNVVNQPLTVLGADEPTTKTIGFTCHEYLGSEIFLYKKEDHINGFDETKLIPITTESGLKKGDEILVPSLFGGYHKMVVKLDSHNVVYGEDKNHASVLRFGEDARNAWVSIGIINLRGISKLPLQNNGDK